MAWRRARHIASLGRLCLPVAIVVSCLLVPGQLWAERLPVTFFTTPDAPPRSQTVCVFQDSHGFVWVCTTEGLKRFDGAAFKSYGVESGLPMPSVTTVLECDDGYWLSTNGGGVVRFSSSQGTQSSPRGSSFAVSVFKVGDSAPTQRVNLLYRDRGGSIWAGTDGGLFRRDQAAPDAGFVRVPLRLDAHPDEVVQIWSIVEDDAGHLWVGSRFGLLRRAPDGQVSQYTIAPEGTNDHVWTLLFHEGRIWLGHNSGLIVFRPPRPSTSRINHLQPYSSPPSSIVTLPDKPGDARRYIPTPSLEPTRIQVLLSSSSGSVWIGTGGGGLVELRDGRFNVYTRSHGLDDLFIFALMEDRGGSLWVGTSRGVLRIARNGFVSYGEADGLGPMVGALFERDGALYATSYQFLVGRLDSNRFTTVRPRLPLLATGWRQRGMILDRLGDWWIGTREGVFRFPRVRRFEELADTPPAATYTIRDGLGSNDVATFFEDRHGDIWMSHFAPGDEVLTRWDRSTNMFHRYSGVHGLRRLSTATAFGEDASGQLWIGFRDGEVVRYDEGHFTQEVRPVEEPDRRVSSIVHDGRGVLWISIRHVGLLRLDTRTQGRERQRLFTEADGLASRDVGVLVADGRDNLYVEVGRRFGIDVLDLNTHSIRHLPPSEGVPDTDILEALCDKNGAIWLSTPIGLFRFTPIEERPAALPDTRIESLSIDGTDIYVPALGVADLGAFVLTAGRNRFEVSFFGLTSRLDGGVRYQYRLEGAGDEWSEPSEQRMVTLVSLAPGRYRFLVRAVSGDGRVSDRPASVALMVPPPIWQRWWFLTVAALVIGAIAYLLHRTRVTRLVALQRVRMRIATDLHDDIGSGLSQVAALSEVVGRRIGGDARVTEPISKIGELSRDLVDSMNDIVWAINPARDHASDLTHRMRRFASEVLGGRDIAFDFAADDHYAALPLGPDIRREVWLIFKESVNNIVRHADAARVHISFQARPDVLRLSIQDDGRGFDSHSLAGPSVPAGISGDGTGLSSMRQRAARLGATLDVVSDPGKGTTIALQVPLRQRRAYRRVFS